MEQTLAAHVILLCQKRLLPTLTGQKANSPLEICFSAWQHEQCMALMRLLAEAQDALQYAVNPARVLDWLAVHMYVLGKKS